MSQPFQIRFWLTPEASTAINQAAQSKGVSRGQYIQDTIWDSICRDLPGHDTRENLLPLKVKNTATSRMWQQNHAPGPSGRWSKWVQGRMNAKERVPSILHQLAKENGYGSGTAYLRDQLREAIYRDLGKYVEMPPGLDPKKLLGGVAANEEVW